MDHSQRPCGHYCYRETRTDAPPEVVDSSFNRPRYSFPLRGNTVSTSPWQGYHNNESLDTGIGGYYVLGLQRNLHGGVHFFPPAEQKLAPVNAAAPGYVVAARLPGDKAPCLQDGVLESFGNWPGFVLVRHELEEMPSDSQAQPRRGTFYSLYMHLSSPVFPPGVADKPSQKPSMLDNYFSQVPWFRELYKRRFGAWVNISGQGAEPGTLRWAQEPVPPSDQEPPKPGGPKRVCKVLADNLSLEDITVCDDKGQVHWLYKAPPANLKAALAALEKGQVITFAEPFFPVEAGELLGFLRPLPGHSAILHGHLKDFEDERNAPESARKSKEMKLDAGFMHFQVFSPEDAPDNGIKLLVELAEKLDTKGGGKPRFVELKEDTQDNFLELDEIKNHLTTTLPPEDQADFNKATHQYFAQSSQSDDDGFGYGPAVANFLDQNTSFAPQAKAPEWESCHRFNYPLTLEIETVYLPPPEKNSMVSGGSYKLELHFERANGDDWTPMPRPRKGCACGPFAGNSTGCKPATLEINAKKLGEAKNGVLSFSLMVPALAERMRLKAASGFVIDQTMSLPGADGRMFVEGITRRWRNVRLIQKNEWVPQNARTVLKKLIAALEEQGQQHPKEEDVSQVAWCDPEKEAHIPRIIEGEEKASTPLFSDSGPLAPSHLLENLHPVTSVWLLNVLDKQKKAVVRDNWPVPGFRKEDPSPLYFGGVKKAGERHLGESLLVTVIDEDYGYDKENRVSILARQGAKTLTIASGRQFAPGGNIVQPLPLSFWGDWTLELTDTATPPKTLSPRHSSELLQTKFSIPRPKLMGELDGEDPIVIEQPIRLADGSWRWFFPFEEPAPLELPGFISLRLSETPQGPGTPQTEAMIPFTARPVQPSEEPLINDKLFKRDEANKDFIVGLTEEGEKVLSKGKQTLFLIKDRVSFKDCLAAMDIRVGWGLVKGLALLKEKKLPFELLKIKEDGLSCSLQLDGKPDKHQAALAEQNAQVEKLVTKGKKTTLDVRFASARCEDPRQQALWLFDETCEFILKNKPTTTKSKLGALAYSKYESACRAGQSPRLHVMLVAALGQVAAQNKKLPPLVRIETGGLACVLNVEGKGVADRVRVAAAEAGTFDVDVADPADKRLVRLTAHPGRKNWLSVSFHPGRLFDLLARGDLPPGAERFYWFDFTALSGLPLLYPFGGETTGEGDGSITRARFEELKAEASDSLRISHPRPGLYRKVGFRPMDPQTRAVLAFKPVPKREVCELEISACVSGTPEDLNKFTARFSRLLPGSQKWEVLKNFAALKPKKLAVRSGEGVADWLVSARVPYPAGSKAASLEGVHQFKLELVSVDPGADLKSLQAEGKYDFTPRWEGGLKVERKGEVVEVRGHAEGVEVPVPGTKDAAGWAVAREFELVIDFDSKDKAPDSSTPKPKPEYIRYATPHPTTPRGGCDPNGDFVATVEVQALVPRVQYQFSVRRPLDAKSKKPRPVRQTDMKPCSAPFKLES
ncbi:hypothetical protein [Cystobacter fuscus]|uniref:hypothetical protein n=1 Tax=Cystobacter fuscus TaxID=43 RepID=UPI002B28A9E1|nr:hypothetical protein F0U63_13795 [Cystobacter fuscus]